MGDASGISLGSDASSFDFDLGRRRHQSPALVEGRKAVAMPKKYSVEMRLVEEEDGSKSAVETEPISEYGDDEQAARKGFKEKVQAAKGHGQGQGPGTG